MVWLRRTLEILQVAADARGVRAREVVVIVHVALRALHRRVRPGQREAGRGMVKIRIQPRGCAVALLTGLRESGTDVVRIRGAIEIIQVAAHARRIRAGQVVIAIHVTLHALHGCVGAGQGEAGGGVVKVRAHPRCRVVALGTGL